MSQPKAFLEALFSGKPDNLFLLLWTLPEKESRWFGGVQDAIRYASSLSGHDLYVGVGLVGQDYGPKRRCPSDEIAGIVAVWADIDLQSEAHSNPNLPATIEQALSIVPSEFPPSIVVRTGNGVHVWWLLKEAWIFDCAEERCRAAKFVERWHTLLRDNASQRGWGYERLADLARVLRVPGTMNHKDPANSKPVAIHYQADLGYNSSDLAEYLNDVGVADDDASAAAGQQWAQQFQDKPLKIDLNATISQEQLDRWMAADPRFKQTWFRQRPDLQDQTQSGYDMALANFGARMGLEVQQIVDLMVLHRRMHKKQPRTAPAYFQRTLSKAAQQAQRAVDSGAAPEPAPFEEPADAEAGTGTQPNSERPPNSDQQKIKLCKQISSALGVDLLRMVKVSGDQPLFRMDLADGSILFPDAGKLISQAAVRTAIAGRVSVMIPNFKQLQWRALVQMMLDACIVQDGGEELESQGVARLQIREYLSETAFIPGIEGQTPRDLRKPMIPDDQISVCASDLQNYINRTKAQSISVQAVVAMLSAVGAKMERVRGKKFKEQSRWMLPLEQFDPADYASAVPGGPHD